MSDPVNWTERLTETLKRYDDDLLRSVTARLVRPRGQWPAQELVKRCAETTSNAPVIDRRLQDLSSPGQQLLSLLGRSRQPRWYVGHLIELLAMLGATDTQAQLLDLFDAGLLFPDLPTNPTFSRLKLKSFNYWLAESTPENLQVLAPPGITARTVGLKLELPDLARPWSGGVPAWREADGLEWLLRLAVLWQQVRGAPLRRTQQGDFFKRDLDRLRSDPLLSVQPGEALAELPDPALLAVALGQAEGSLQLQADDLHAMPFSPAWEEGLPSVLAALWACLPLIRTWNPVTGWRVEEAGANPYPPLNLLALLLVTQAAPGQSVPVASIADWLARRHPYWNVSGEEPDPEGVPAQATERFLLGLAQQLGLVRAARDAEGAWHVQATALGVWVAGGAEPPATPAYPQTLLVQPNLEILVYRQGLTPALLRRLTGFATWKTIGAACTLQLDPEMVYAGLQSGESFESLVQLLERHGMKPTPTTVIESLRTWANKHERITVYPAGTLFEFLTPEDLNDALARGLPAERITERLAVVANEKGVNFSHFRLTATRDYLMPAERCVQVETDGITLSIDLARSDLLLDTELQRFAEPLGNSDTGGKRQYRLTPTSTAEGRQHGLTLPALEAWFLQRTGQPISPAARLLLTGGSLAPLELRQVLVVNTSDAATADGLLQWPGTRALIVDRLGPTALVIAEEHLDLLRERLAPLGIKLPAPETA